MKKLFIITALSLSLVACGNEETVPAESNQISDQSTESKNHNMRESFIDNTTENHWISYDGSSPVHEEFSYTDRISYNPEKTYTINSFGYISYFNGEDFITTKKITKPYPKEIETVKDADNIKISFQTAKAENIELLVK